MKSKQIKKYRKDQRYFVEKEKIEKFLTCSICQEIFDDPYRITCGHTFCKNCLNQWEKQSRNGLCPLCRKKYNKRFSGKDLIAQSMINEAIVTCIYKGCPWKEKLSNLYDHIQNCLFEPEKLPDFMKFSNFFEKESSNKTEKKGTLLKLEESETNIGNICSFNYTSTIKERIFSRNPHLIEKLFKEDNQEKINNDQNKENKENKEKISENDDVNELYNVLLFDKEKNENKLKNNEIDNKEKEKRIKDKENNNENEQNVQGSSIMNIFINPTINIEPNSFLTKKTEREK